MWAKGKQSLPVGRTQCWKVIVDHLRGLGCYLSDMALWLIWQEDLGRKEGAPGIYIYLLNKNALKTRFFLSSVTFAEDFHIE